ncbi:MAG: fatty acyl-AMP ligase [Planctomycetota bacterium]
MNSFNPSFPPNPRFAPSESIIDALVRSAAEAPSNGISIFDRRGQKSEFNSYPTLLQRVKDCAGRMAAAGIGPGDRVLIGLPTSWDLVDAILGAMMRGALPTMVAPPGALGGAAGHAVKIRGLVELLGSKRIYCDDSSKRLLIESGSQDLADLAITPEEFSAFQPAPGIVRPAINPSDIAFMQLTSGSTGRQRAVMIRHSNLMANSRAICDILKIRPYSSEQTVVSWLPLHHDMGLVGCLLFSIAYGVNLKVLRPESFLARPKLWMQLMASGSITQTPAPNFAYQLCVERVDVADLAGCDLSKWKVALTGAEMIRPETCEAFVEKFGPLGFDKRAFLPSFGMAETTLLVSGDTRHAGIKTIPAPADARAGLGMKELVSNGFPVLDTSLRISPAGSPHSLLDGQIGEVCVNSPSVFAGYYNSPEATAAALQDDWLRTGDLGFMHDGELYLTGRIKDVLIVNGHNIMPHEIEWLAESATGAGGSERCGAFSIARGAEGEQAVVVLEISDMEDAALPALAHDIRSRVGRTLGLPLADVVLVKRGIIPKTTSGKVQRRELRTRYLDNTLERRF